MHMSVISCIVKQHVIECCNYQTFFSFHLQPKPFLISEMWEQHIVFWGRCNLAVGIRMHRYRKCQWSNAAIIRHICISLTTKAVPYIGSNTYNSQYPDYQHTFFPALSLPYRWSCHQNIRRQNHRAWSPLWRQRLGPCLQYVEPITQACTFMVICNW